MGTGPLSVDSMPPVPTDPQELEGWLSDRNLDLRNAIEFGNPELVGQIGCLIGQGAKRLELSGRDQSMESQHRQAIEQNAKRLCVSSAGAGQCM